MLPVHISIMLPPDELAVLQAGTSARCALKYLWDEPFIGFRGALAFASRLANEIVKSRFGT